MGEVLLMVDGRDGRATGRRTATGRGDARVVAPTLAGDGIVGDEARRAAEATRPDDLASRRAGRAGAVRRRLRSWRSRGGADVVTLGDAGMATAEYAIATVAAAGFAGLLIVVLRSDEVRGMLVAIVRGALTL